MLCVHLPCLYQHLSPSIPLSPPPSLLPPSLPLSQEEALILSFAARNPTMQFCYTTMACGVYEALEGEQCIHIVDFAMWAGQWPLVIRQLAARHRQHHVTGLHAVQRHLPSPSHPPSLSPPPLHIRFTAVEAPKGHPWGPGPKLPAAFLYAELNRAASECGVQLSFACVESRPETLRPYLLSLARGEAVVVNFAGRLANLADSTVLRSSPKDAALAVSGWEASVYVPVLYETILCRIVLQQGHTRMHLKP